jgi:putative transcriptional regulator
MSARQAGAAEHVDDQIAALALGTLPDDERAEVELHLAGCPRCAAELTVTGELLGAMALAPAPVLPSAAARERLLSAVAEGGRLHRFAEPVARLLEITVAAARAVLDSLDAPERWKPLALPGSVGVDYLRPPTGQRLEGAAVAFLRIGPGGRFPTHTHLAPEQVLILQGGYIDEVSGLEYGPGQIHAEGQGTSHAYRHVPGPDCLCLGVVEGHVQIGDLVL